MTVAKSGHWQLLDLGVLLGEADGGPNTLSKNPEQPAG
jgi:hypothetical protein